MDFLGNSFNYIVHFATVVKDQFINNYITNFGFMSCVELIIMLLGFACIHLMVRENRYAWLISAFNCFVLVFIWSQKHMVGQAALYAFYVLNGLYAFMFWNKRDKNNKKVVKLKYLPPLVTLLHLVILAVITTIIVLIINFLKTHYGLKSNSTILDISIVFGSLYTIVLQVRKYIESMAYFTIIDMLVFAIYVNLDLYLLALVRLYIAIMCGYGFIKWISRYKREQQQLL